MPVIVPASGTTMDLEDRLRALLSADSGLTDLYSGAIRDFAPTGVSAADEVVVSIHTADEDYFPETLSCVRTQPRLILTVQVAEPQENPDVSAVRRRCVDVTTRFRDAIWKYRQDPTPGDSRWWAIRFGRNPSTQYQREPQVRWLSLTQFDVRTQKGNP
jgi:hypothetical protein